MTLSGPNDIMCDFNGGPEVGIGATKNCVQSPNMFAADGSLFGKESVGRRGNVLSFTLTDHLCCCLLSKGVERT